MVITWKMWPLECEQGFLLIWPGDLVFYPRWPSFEPDLKIIKTNILSKIHDNCLKNVTARVLTKFLLIWPGDLVFDSKWSSFELELELIKTNILSQIHDDCLKNVNATVITRFYADLAWWTTCSFWVQVFQFRTWPRNHQDNYFEPDSWWLLQKCER